MEYVIENNDDSEIQLKALYLGHSISNHIICNVHTDVCYIKIVKFLSIYENYQYELSEVIEKALLKEKKENNKTLNKVKKIINRKENSEILLVDKIVSDYIDKKLEEEEERNKPKRKVCIKILRTPTLD
jgi:signal transduction histidine kinase